MAFTFTGLPYSFAVSGNSFVSVLDDTRKEVVSISTTGNEKEITLTVQSGKTLTVKNTMVLDSPPRIIYDIPYNGASFQSINNTLTNQLLKSIRVGYHSGDIRMVLDINGTGIPKFTHRVNNHELIIMVTSIKKGNDKETNEKGSTPQNNSKISGISSSKENNHINSNKELADDNLKETAAVVQEQKPKYIIPENKSDYDTAELLQKKMTGLEQNDSSEEAALFLKGVNAYNDNDFQKATEHLKNLIKTYPMGKYSEKAYFLLSKSFEQLYTKTSSEHFSTIKNSFDDAIYKFPSSIFAPDALLSAGNLCLKTNNFSEAIAYYNRVIKNNYDSFTTVRALLQKGEALSQKGKYAEAISTYENIIQDNGACFGKTEAQLGIAKALFEMNSFNKSITLLTGIEKETENIYRYPDISLYLGYNYYQMGNYNAAINMLFRFYNIYPNSKANHLVLSKIGDAYRAINLPDAASKIYKLVFDQFPQTEGALISLTRIAEQQEGGELKKGNNFIPFTNPGEKLSSPHKIYEMVISEYSKKDSKNPMLEYTLLKQALLYKKENNYAKSMEVLEYLLKNYPSSKLHPEIIYALTDNFEKIVKDRNNIEENKAAYIDIINIYLRGKNIIRRLASSKTLLAISLACINLGLEDMASELLLEADTVFPDKEKPNELLFYLGKYLVKNGQQEKGLKSLDTLTSQCQSGEFVAKAYHIKGILLEENKKHERAIEMYSQALKSNPEVEDRIMILADKALVLAESGLNIESLQTAQEAKEILARYPKQKQFVYQKVGEICLALGKPEDALSLFNNAIAAKKDDNENMKLRFLIAQCYEALNRKNDYIDAYNQLTKSADPLWSRLAKEKMEAIIFKELLSKTEFNKYRR